MAVSRGREEAPRAITDSGMAIRKRQECLAAIPTPKTPRTQSSMAVSRGSEEAPRAITALGMEIRKRQEGLVRTPTPKTL